jgi:2-polyprenyl-3-methyl-5-hydroxy-6-metoxy-1,4-benzoquinol methylase
MPTPEELQRYYDSAYRDGMYRTFVAADDMKRATAARRYKEIKDYCRPGRWLDVGCSNGVFVAHALTEGQHAEGIDLSRVAVDDAVKRRIPCSCTTLEDHEPGYLYDTLTLFDLLEHVLDPVSILESAREHLRPGGTIALTTPNKASLYRRLMGRRWFFYIPEEHIHYFEPRTISTLLQRTGFASIRCSKTYKPLTLAYSLAQFKEYNPLVFKILSPLSRLLPARLTESVIPLYIGEMLALATRR